MSLVVNHNLMAANTARNLNAHYGRLQTSTQRLSSGLRVNSAADDAAGLAIRELQRADIAALQQGARNANDAISMIQTADGALGIIDEKLIRMKELAEQAATGTYDSTQRLMIESENQAMASEITRIANATDFNGMKLLDGTLSSDEHDGSGMTATGKMKIHFGTGNDSAEDYYYITIGDCRASAFGVGNESTWESVIDRAAKSYGEALKAAYKDEPEALAQISQAVENLKTQLTTLSDYTNPDGQVAKEVYDNLDKYWPSSTPYPLDDAGADLVDENNVPLKNNIVNADQKLKYAFGKAAMNLIADGTIGVDLTGCDKITDADPGLNAAVKVTNGADFAGYTVATQEDAQHALDAINDAIVSKDKIRAHLGAVQNRLENTITNLNVQAENLQAAESRISDVDVATEMTQFVRNQILTQSAVAMLGQANSLPQMAMQLIGG